MRSVETFIYGGFPTLVDKNHVSSMYGIDISHAYLIKLLVFVSLHKLVNNFIAADTRGVLLLYRISLLTRN